MICGYSASSVVTGVHCLRFLITLEISANTGESIIAWYLTFLVFFYQILWQSFKYVIFSGIASNTGVMWKISVFSTSCWLYFSNDIFI